jgi:Asp-tRNA(Asn)/Glu-tRNA(Gln) amidotransferase A subunit family amidase
VPHDAREPCHFTFGAGGRRVGVLTDAGHITPHMVERLSPCDALAVEANHDLDSLRRGPYPDSLKHRVASKFGHLNNTQTNELLSRLDRARIQWVVGLHLSEQNNTPEQVRAAVNKAMDGQKIDAWVYPTWSNPPRLIGDLNTPGGDNSQFFSPTTGFPSIQVPMGYTRGGRLPAGITFFGRAWSEPTLIKYAYAYEQATDHRRAPESTPPLR